MRIVTATIPPPPFHNVEVGPLTFHGYGLMLGIAIILAIRIAEWGLVRLGQDASRFTGVALISVVVGFVGARLYHVASEPIRYLHAPADIVKVWHGGLGIYGGVLLGALVGLALAPRFGLSRTATADAITPALLSAQAVGRIGNYLNQELFGRPFDGPWALEVDPARRPAGYVDQATFHPTFLYEAIGTASLAIVFAWLLVRWRSRPPGITCRSTSLPTRPSASSSSRCASTMPTRGSGCGRTSGSRARSSSRGCWRPG